ncbi:Ribosome biogenesis protein BRX1-like protein [Frankliniella fusca]|uniref:Ribosome biogenesis protein BRX1 homolog n=1 Tax=Frankliniella fusca TaxID=407009 RepID=A0AAE1L6N1_9NEOP|nr:Ribosome biogenesis protein BRX1-like protein [Frankliniella fusca]
MGVKIGKKRKQPVQNVDSDEEDQVELPPTTRSSDEPPLKKAKWINKQRVLVFAARGINHRDRHLMGDIRTLLPHCRSENKIERRENLFVVNEVCEMRNCNKAILFEGRLRRDLYMWLANISSGPSAKFLVENVYTMAELKLTGNCLKGSRPLLSFDKAFDGEPHYQLLKELLIQIFGTPNGHPKSQPFVDHVLTFSILDNRIWFRNYQILAEDGALAEIGPRFVLNPIKIFDGSFGGATLWENPLLCYRRQMNKSAASKYLSRVTKKAHHEHNKPGKSYSINDDDDIFVGDAFEKAKEILEKQKEEESLSTEEKIRKPKKIKKKGNAKGKANSQESVKSSKSPQSAKPPKPSKSNGISPKRKKGNTDKATLTAIKKAENKKSDGVKTVTKTKKGKVKAKTGKKHVQTE